MKWLFRVCCTPLILTLLAPLQAWGSSWSVVTRDFDEVAIVFSAADVRARNLPARIHERNLPPVFGSQVVLACLGIPFQPGDLLVYLPSSRQCMPYNNDHSPALDLSSAVTSPVSSLQQQPSLKGDVESADTIILQPASAFGITVGACVCPINPPDNDPPVASVQSGSPQEAITGEFIEQIAFFASDTDDSSISHTFTYTLDGGSAVSGLPQGLSESCTPGNGTLACNVNGTAPPQIGIYRIRFSASDGSASDSATATLTVIEEVLDDLVFKNGFEDIQ